MYIYIWPRVINSYVPQLPLTNLDLGAIMYADLKGATRLCLWMQYSEAKMIDVCVLRFLAIVLGVR